MLSGLFRRPSHARGEGGNNPFLIWSGGRLCDAIRLIRDANNVVYVEASDGSSLRISENWIMFQSFETIFFSNLVIKFQLSHLVLQTFFLRVQIYHLTN